MPTSEMTFTFTEHEIGVLFQSLIVYPAHRARFHEAGGPEYSEEIQAAWTSLMGKLFPEGVRAENLENGKESRIIEPREASSADFPREL